MDDGNALRRGLRSAAEGGPLRQVNEQAEIAMGRSIVLERNSRLAELVRSPGASDGARMTTIHTEVTFMDQSWPEPAPPAERQFALFGRMKWGQAGALFEADVDIHHGSAFSMVASYAELSVGWDPASSDAANSRIERVNIAGALVWGTRPGRPFPTRTLRGVIPAFEAAPVSFTLRIPQWAYAFQVHTPRNAYYAEGFASQRITVHSGPLVTDDPILDLAPSQVGVAGLTFDGIKLAEGAHYITFSNLAIAAATPLRVVFPLNL